MSEALRIAVVNWTDRIAGGAERYLHELLPELQRMGHKVAFVHETSEPAGREAIMGGSIRSWSLQNSAPERVITDVAAWQPDLMFQNGLLDPQFEARIIRLASSVLLAHSYYGTCVSGTKTWQSPVPRSCRRAFGWGCLLHYYPHRCGGLNPATVASEFRRQRMRNALLHEYDSVVTLSEHMRNEYERAGVAPTLVPLILQRAAGGQARRRLSGAPWHLLFVGRFDALKGGQLLIDALPLVQQRIKKRIELVLAGDGPARGDWEERAKAIAESSIDLRIEFLGWLSGDDLEQQWRRAELLVFPSIWPEPLGLVGTDAARHGVPTVAFRTGAVPEWLIDGVNGHLAVTPPSAASLADAVVRAIGSEEAYLRLLVAAGESVACADIVHHARALSGVFAEVAARRLTI